jgi:hypothetical protein
VERSEAVGSGDLLDDLEAGVPEVVDQLYINGFPLVNTIMREELFPSFTTRLLITRFLGLAALVRRVVKVGPVGVLVVARFG